MTDGCQSIPAFSTTLTDVTIIQGRLDMTAMLARLRSAPLTEPLAYLGSREG